MTRWFMNLPTMPSLEAVEAAVTFLDGLGVGGYAAVDGLRANVEIDQSVAEMLDMASDEAEMRACALEAIAERMRT